MAEAPQNKSSPRTSSPLREAYELTQKVSALGFDWPHLEGVLTKLEEEIEELKEALLLGEKEKAKDELGDILFVLVNLSRFLKVHPEKALSRTIRKFKTRFRYVEKGLQSMGKSFEESNLAEMDGLWEEAKARSKRKARGAKAS